MADTFAGWEITDVVQDSPELQRAMTGTGDYRGLPPDEHIKPNKWNNHETRTRREILTQDVTPDPNTPWENTPSPEPVSNTDPMAGWEVTPVKEEATKAPVMKAEETAPEEVAPPEGWTVEDVSVEPPTMLQALGQGYASAAGSIEHTLRGAVAAGVGLVNTDKADEILKEADRVQGLVNQEILTPEQQQMETLPQKIAGVVGGFAPTAVAFAANPVAGLATLTVPTFYEGATQKLKEGVDLKRAEATGLIQATGAGIAGLLPGVGTTYLRTLGLTGGANVAIGGVTDLIVREMFPDRPDIQKNYDPLDPEKRTLDLVTGVLIGSVFHGAKVGGEKMSASWKKTVDERATREFVDNILPELNKIIPQPRKTFEAYADMTPGETLEYIIKNGDPTKERVVATTGEDMGLPDAKITDALDLISSDDTALPHQRALAQALVRTASRMGLDVVGITKLTPKDIKEKPNLLGRYNREFDEVRVRPGRTEHTDLISTILHETVHAITNKAIDRWKEVSMNPALRRTLEPHEQVLYDKVDRLNTLFEHARAKLLSQRGKDNIIDSGARDQYFRENFDKTLEMAKAAPKDSWIREDLVHKLNENYGMLNLHEFVSEILTNKGFGERLGKMNIKVEDLPALRTKGLRPLTNLFHAVRDALRQVVGLPRGSVYELGLEHAMGLIEHVKASDRTLTGRDQIPVEIRQGLPTAMLRRIAGIVQKVHTKNELLTRLMVQSENDTWRNWVAENAETIWNNPGLIIDAAGKSNFKDLSPTMQKLVGDDRTVDEFFSDTFGEYLKENRKLIQAQDLKGAGRRLFAPNILNMMKEGIAGDVLRFVNRQAAEYNSMSKALYHHAVKMQQSFSLLDMDSKKKLINTIAFYDRPVMREILREQGLQWMSDEMLTQRGHNETEISAYHDLTKSLDFLHDLANQALVKQGLPPIPQIPGYMPHVYRGAYKVFVQMTRARGEGERPDEFIVEVKAFKYRQQAEQYAKLLETGKYDTGTETFRAQVDPQTLKPYKVRRAENLMNSLMGGIQEHVQAYNNGLILQPQTLHALEKIELDNMRGFTKHILERSNVGGYLGEYGLNKSLGEHFGMLSAETKATMKLFENYAKNIVEYYRNTLFVDEVASKMNVDLPMENEGKLHYRHLFENTPELNKHLSEFEYNFTGKNLNHINVVDKVAQDISEKLGVDPMMYRKIARGTRNTLSLVKLRANPSNYFANWLQPLQMLSLLEMTNQMLRHDGVEAPSVLETVASIAKQKWRGMDRDQISAQQWAQDQHHLDPQLDHELLEKSISPLGSFIHKWTGGAINPAIEASSRKTTFMIAYEHFRKVFPNDPQRAREAAVQLMEMTMINYDTPSRPMMYQNFGVLGEAISPFAVFRNGYIGNTLLMGKLILTNKNLSSLRPLLATQLTFLATAGLIGTIGASEYDIVVKLLNKIAPELKLDSFEALVLKHGLPDWMVFGAVSDATKLIPGLDHGVYLGSSMNSVGADDVFSAALLPFVEAIAAVGGVSAKAVASLVTDSVNQPKAEDYYKAGKQLIPGILQPYWEKAFMKNDVAPQSSSLEGGVKRTPSDWRAYMLVGKRSLAESRESMVNRELAKSEQQNKQIIKDLVTLGVDKAMGLPSPTDYEELVKRVATFGVDRAQFAKQVLEGMQNRMLSQRYQEAQRQTRKGMELRQQREEMGE